MSTPMVLACPVCQVPHVDKDAYATLPHKTHLCESCGHLWRPYPFDTVGVTKAQLDALSAPDAPLPDTANLDDTARAAQQAAIDWVRQK